MDSDADEPKSRYPWYVRMIIGRNLWYTLFRAIVWAALIIVLFKFVLIGIRVRGQSMEPNFHDGQIKFINRLAYLRHPPRRGDVIAFRAEEYDALILKRVIALPGETISIHGRGDIYIDGKLLVEPYETKGRTSYRGSESLKPDQYFLFGDNREVSERYYKYNYQILGKVLF
jgi:signal peptidase I